MVSLEKIIKPKIIKKKKIITAAVVLLATYITLVGVKANKINKELEFFAQNYILPVANNSDYNIYTTSTTDDPNVKKLNFNKKLDPLIEIKNNYLEQNNIYGGSIYVGKLNFKSPFNYEVRVAINLNPFGTVQPMKEYLIDLKNKANLIKTIDDMNKN